jgi:hypothetical protein
MLSPLKSRDMLIAEDAYHREVTVDHESIPVRSDRADSRTDHRFR